MKPLLIALALLSTAGTLWALVAALQARPARAHGGNAWVLGLSAAATGTAMLINPDAQLHAPGLLAWLVLAAVAAVYTGFACRSRTSAHWPLFWCVWLLSAALSLAWLWLWLFFRITW